jgi:hypothetical protein
MLFATPPHADARVVLDHTQRPDLRTTQADLFFNLLEVGANSVENHPEAAQHLRRVGGIDGIWVNWFHDGMDRKKGAPKGSELE